MERQKSLILGKPPPGHLFELSPSICRLHIFLVTCERGSNKWWKKGFELMPVHGGGKKSLLLLILLLLDLDFKVFNCEKCQNLMGQ